MNYKEELVLAFHNYHRSFSFPRISANTIRRTLFLGFILVMLSVLMHLSTASVQSQANTKKLIQSGWDMPTPNFMRKHIKQMEQRPFDGVIIKLNAGKEVFKKKPYPDTAFTQDRKDLAAIKSSKLANNFIVMWSAIEEGWDWFNDDDWAAAEKNIQNFAKTAKAGRFKGIAFDLEPYGYTPWHYEAQPQHDNKTFQEYQQQVRKRGARFMRVLQTTQPRTEVLTLGLFSWMKALLAQTTDPAKLQQKLVNHKYGLWPAFVNGMLDAARPGSVIIDGNEGAYYFYRAAWFGDMRDIIRKDARAFVDPANRKKYDNQVKTGQAVYMDLVLDLFEKPANNAKNAWYGMRMPHFLSPNDRLRLLEHNIYHALKNTDKYAWVWGERMDWWRNRIPKGAEDAIRRAKAKIQKGKPLGFDIDVATTKALNKCKAINSEC
ncbi:MAG: hypothetical protein IGS49_02370 [Chlorogloeopsis fritschii C42_A2020_084]|jgi:hypothetical protein|uniref:hypothetical protein n=1 Tax=Chlorogloeopsis fritschii TaxID=1124 RepID=UPI0019E91827|nr:hypothetical protein [Chlorogloeopsis fritschii]MBF2004337.1 hypothetical protein [Chlorogloeopsis fritschii C42_A2020_084]